MTKIILVLKFYCLREHQRTLAYFGAGIADRGNSWNECHIRRKTFDGRALPETATPCHVWRLRAVCLRRQAFFCRMYTTLYETTLAGNNTFAHLECLVLREWVTNEKQRLADMIRKATKPTRSLKGPFISISVYGLSIFTLLPVSLRLKLSEISVKSQHTATI